MGYRILRTLLLTLILGVFTALSAQNEPAARASYGDYLIMGLVHRGDLPVNPFRITSLAEKEIAQLIFGYGLTKTPDKYGSPPPLIGPPINKPEDSKYRIWEFALARGVSFHDGSEFRNKDVIFTFSFLKKFGGYLFNRNLDFRNVLRISPGQGDLEVVFELRDPDPDFLRKLADIPILPEKYYAEAMAVGHAAFAVQPPIGMGPFRLDIQTPTEIVMVHHPFYHAGRPFLDGVRVILFEDEQELLDALVEGRIDYLELPDPGTARRLHSLLRKRIGIFPVPRHEQTVTTLLFNVNHGPLASIPVRQAIDMALNRQTMVDRFMPDYAEPAYSLLGSDDPHFYKKISTKKFNPRL
nr:ABC transporter substrate-binding protein [Calditrichia bacterium]